MMEYGRDERTPGPDKGHPQQPRQQQPQGAHEPPRHHRRRGELALDSAPRRPPARLLPGDRQRHLHHSHLGRARPGPQAAARLHPRRAGQGNQARRRLPLSARPHNQGRRTLRRPPPLRAGRPHHDDIDVTGCYDAFTYTTSSSSRTTASAKRARARTTSPPA